jgi:uncharacterized protein YjiS (DUF1127 family)
MTAFMNTNELIQPTISGFSGYKTASPFARLLNALGKLPVYARQYGTFYRTREELSRLSDRSLSDIGIDREEIAKIAREHHEQALIRHDQTGMTRPACCLG